MKDDWTLEDLLNYGRTWDIRERDPWLLRPHCLQRPKSAPPLRRLLTDILSLYPETGKRLFLEGLAACAVLSDRKVQREIFQWLAERAAPSDIGLPCVSWEAMADMGWSPIAILTVWEATGKAKSVRALLGRGHGEKGGVSLPEGLEARMDGDAREAVRRAAERSLGPHPSHGLLFWPFLGDLTLRGGSLGLPLYLGWRALLEDRQPPRLAATGTIGPDGDLLPAAGLREKVDLAREEGLQGLLYPEANSLTPLPARGFETIPVRDLETAEAFGLYHSPGKASLMMSLVHGVEDPCLLVRAALGTAPGFVSWLEARSQGLTKAVQRALADPHTAREVVSLLETQSERPDRSGESLSLILETLSPERVRTLGTDQLETAFRIAQVQILRANHSGDVEGTCLWQGVAEGGVKRVLDTHEGEARVLRLYNTLLVRDHNAFRFDPSAPEKLPGEVAEILDARELALARRRSSAPRAVDLDLGAFYGTLAQNAAFCGPGWFASFEGFVEKALDAFGGGKVPEAAEDNWLRALSYRVYACLDAGRTSEAGDCLRDYLCIKDLAAYHPSKKNPYREAALMRYLADSGESCPGYLPWALCMAPAVPASHPWQLWLYNLGRLREAPEDRKGLWERALSLCEDPQEPTLRAMALLPLAALHGEGLRDEPSLKRDTEAVLRVLGGGILNAEHFRVVLDAPNWGEALMRVRGHLKRLFPFSYR